MQKSLKLKMDKICRPGPFRMTRPILDCCYTHTIEFSAFLVLSKKGNYSKEPFSLLCFQSTVDNTSTERFLEKSNGRVEIQTEVPQKVMHRRSSEVRSEHW